jgi:hypothetical protein
MTTTTSVHGDIFDALEATSLHVAYGPATDLPTTGGLVAQSAVLWPFPRAYAYTRANGESSGGTDRLTVTCVGATVRDALAVADKVEAAIGGMRLSSKGGTLRQTGASVPTPEPNADPARVSMAVEYSTVTKG